MSFNGERLRVLRLFHNKTQRELADAIGATASAITEYERGQVVPKGIVLDALCAVLQASPEYFDDAGVNALWVPQVNFRSLRSTTERLRKKVVAHTMLLATFIEYLRTEIELGILRLPKISAATREELELGAERVRIDLGIGIDAPIANVVHLAEHAGIIVTVLDAAISRQVDAFSLYGQTNLIVLNPAKDVATRARMDIAHEIGHGAAHRDRDTEGTLADLREREAQADFFAGALLMPRDAFAREYWMTCRSWNWEGLVQLKERWGASIPAIVMRSYQLGLIDAAEYRRRYKYMSKIGWMRGAGPKEPPAEEPQLLALAVTRYRAETGKSLATIAAELHWSTELFTSVTGMDVDAPVPGVTSVGEFRQRRAALG